MATDKITVTIDKDLEDLIPGFLGNRKKDVDSLRQAFADANIESLKSIGHSLKGVGGGYGFNGLSEIGAEIERMAKSGEIAGIPALIERMADYLDNLEIIFE